MPKIVTTFVPYPALRRFDWHASYDGEEPDHYGHVASGYGKTEQCAINDLIANHPREIKVDEITALDLAWERINAIGGADSGSLSPFSHGINFAVRKALAIIEELGGSDPLPKRADLRGAR